MEKKAYTEREKVLLATLVREHGAAIENKKTDGSSIQGKQAAWEKIAAVYNVQPENNSLRSSKQLKKLWDNLKQKKRKEVTAEKYARLLTGGGPEEEPPADPLMELVDTAAPYMDVTIDCSWDSTALYEKNLDSSTTAAARKSTVTVVEATAVVPRTTAAAPKRTVSTAEATAVVPRTTAAAPKRTVSTAEATAVVPRTMAAAPSTVAVTTPSTSKTVAPADVSTPTNAKRARVDNGGLDEKYWRVLKARESVYQQRELHEKRMEAAKAEAELALMKLNYLSENQQF